MPYLSDLYRRKNIEATVLEVLSQKDLVPTLQGLKGEELRHPGRAQIRAAAPAQVLWETQASRGQKLKTERQTLIGLSMQMSLPQGLISQSK